MHFKDRKWMNGSYGEQRSASISKCTQIWSSYHRKNIKV